jgi:hypothetical protein
VWCKLRLVHFFHTFPRGRIALIKTEREQKNQFYETGLFLAFESAIINAEGISHFTDVEFHWNFELLTERMKSVEFSVKLVSEGVLRFIVDCSHFSNIYKIFLEVS